MKFPIGRTTLVQEIIKEAGLKKSQELKIKYKDKSTGKYFVLTDSKMDELYDGVELTVEVK